MAIRMPAYSTINFNNARRVTVQFLLLLGVPLANALVDAIARRLE